MSHMGLGEKIFPKPPCNHRKLGTYDDGRRGTVRVVFGKSPEWKHQMFEEIRKRLKESGKSDKEITKMLDAYHLINRLGSKIHAERKSNKE